jgi:hypothetical protein
MLIALLLGAAASAEMMAIVGGGWKQGALGFVAWALMPYLVLIFVLIGLHLLRLHKSADAVFNWAIVIVALGGPLLYVDAMYIHVDAQGALVVLMIPVIQAALGIAIILAGMMRKWLTRKTGP